MQNRRLVALFLVCAQAGCASATMQRSVYGRLVRVEPKPGGQGEAVEGELLAVSEDRIWIRDKSGVRELPLASVGEARVQRHPFTGKKAMRWAEVGALVSGAGLTGACMSVEDTENCPLAGVSVAALWLLAGGLAALAVGPSRWLRIEQEKLGNLRPFARFPQGLPEETDFLTPEPPALSEQAQTGFLELLVMPWAEVLIDGESVGTAPYREAIELKVGKHLVRLVHPAYLPVEREVRIDPRVVTPLIVDLAKEALPRE